ncbi:MAG: MBL fold metallo-hydrolase [Actinobacteria bacterium]|nr:MBL fold metallo-hydrolase [Actinomycetota bacterium]
MVEKTKITFWGHAMFVIESARGTKIGTDPYDQQVKSRLPDVSADVVLVSHGHFDHSNISLFKGNPKVIRQAGKTSFEDINIEGVPAYHDEAKGLKRGENIIFKFEVDGIKFAHLGDLGHLPDERQVNSLKDVDILLIPVGGIYTIDASQALKIINDIKPKVAIPMHYKEEDTKIGVNTLDYFIGKVKNFKEVGHTVEVSKDELPQETEIWILSST